MVALNFSAGAQTFAYAVDRFDPSGVGGNDYAAGQISNVWGNWFGDAFQWLAWDATSDASNNPASGSLKITADFNGLDPIPNQFEVFNGFNGITPALNGIQYTNFQCDVRFAQGSAAINDTYGYLQFGLAVGYGQDYFGGVTVPVGDTNWVHVSIHLDAQADTNLQNIGDVLIHIYGPSMRGVTTLWVDNIEFVGAAPIPTNCIVRWNEVHQRIDGFGASSAWGGYWTPAEADLLFSTNNDIVYADRQGHTYTNNGIGLSLLRTRVAPGGTTVEGSIMRMAQARGAKVWSTPWSPAPEFKSNHNVNGGSFVGNPANYRAYADELAGYVAYVKKQYGVNLYALSVQNEPDANVTTYESCNWSAQQIHDFIPYLHSALVASNVAATKIMLPESQNWLDYSNLAAVAMSDPSVAGDVGIVADHNYDGANGPAVLAKNTDGKPLWETEVSLLAGSDGSMANGVYWARRIYLFMTVAQANAWHYWWLKSLNSTGNEGLLDTNAAPTKRLFAVGNYSRFVRPGDYRIGVSNNALTSISAYKDPASGAYAIVAVNTDAAPITQIFDLDGFTTDTVTPWITSGSLSLARQPAVAVTHSSFRYTLPALSVVTFVGRSGSNAAPVFQAVPDETIHAGMTLTITNAATDQDVPPQILTYSLLAGPTNATLNASNGVFVWRPWVSQAGTTNEIAVTVADNGTPSLSATNRFEVIVAALAPAELEASGVSGRQIGFRVDGPTGPDYSVLTSTNLLDWQILFTTNSPAPPFTFQAQVPGSSARFFRVQLGP